ncbi:hypothetical protein V4C53_14480 [Paraburkholderia azotifigens]|uniref:hypothetical protein n=1 Tax=Paraburkholderia azotifigens TaxID=2057004 RepID=UPI0031815148
MDMMNSGRRWMQLTEDIIGECRSLVNQRFSTTPKRKCMAAYTWVCEWKPARTQAAQAKGENLRE